MMKKIGILIDPDKTSESDAETLCQTLKAECPDIILVGGSSVDKDITPVVSALKRHLTIPVILFPGSANQFTSKADAILLLSLISGRNAEYLIGQHVLAANRIEESGIKVIPTGYILIDGGCMTSVQRVTQTEPLDPNDQETIVSTALAGKLLGLQALYLEAGSGALNPVPENVIAAVKQRTGLPLIVGGGIRDKEHARKALEAGADVIIVGNAAEKNPELISELTRLTHSFK